MSECNDNRFADMLYAYELGLLGDKDREELEIHLLECEHCFNRAKSFENAAQLLSGDADVKESVFNEFYSGRKSPKPAGKIRSVFTGFRLALAGSVAILALIVMVLHPWSVEFTPSLEAYAAPNRLVVLNFENMAEKSDPDRLGEIATNLLITNLSEYGHLHVISQQRIYDILKNMGEEDRRTIDNELADRIAKESGARWMISGVIVQTDPHIIITCQLIDVKDDRIIASRKISGKTNEAIFSIIDSLTPKVKNDLDVPDYGRDEPEPQSAVLTTNSADAYRFYLEGIENENKLLKKKAVSSFQKALDYDSTFAMAYYHLARHVTIEARKEYIEKALQYSDHIGDKDKRLILSSYYETFGQYMKSMEQLYILIDRYPEDKELLLQLASMEYHWGMYELSISRFEKLIKLDSLYGPAYNMLAYAWVAMGKHKKAIDYINMYIAVSPNEPNPYDSRGDLYLQLNKIDSAIQSFETSLVIEPDFPSAQYALARIYLCRGQYEKASDLLQKVAASRRGAFSIFGLLGEAIIDMRKGKFNSAISNLDRAIEMQGEGAKTAYKASVVSIARFMKARIYAEHNKLEMALTEINRSTTSLNQSMHFNNGVFLSYKIHLMAQSGEYQQAQTFLESIVPLFNMADTAIPEINYSYGVVEFYKGNYQLAEEYLIRSITGDRDFFGNYMLGRLYLESNRPQKAIEAFNKLDWINHRWDYFSGIWDVKMYYYLGLAYQESGDSAKARDSFTKFMDIWAKADMNILEIQDARERLRGLGR